MAVSCGYAVALGLTSLKLKEVMSRLEDDGRPMTSQEVIPEVVPDTENAALVYEAVSRILKSAKVNGDSAFATLERLLSEENVTQDQAEMEKQFLEVLEQEQVRQAFLLLQHATHKKFCVYDLDYSKGAGLLLPHISELMSLSRILCAGVTMKLERGDVSAAWDDALTALRFANALEDEPLLISQLVRLRMFLNAAEVLQRVAVQVPPNEEQLREAVDLLSSFDDMTPLIRALDGERLLFGGWVFGLSREELRRTTVLGGDDPSVTLQLVTTLTPLMRYDEARYLEVMHTLTRHVQEMTAVPPAEMEESLMEGVPFFCIFTRMLVPAVSSVQETYLEMVATARVMQAGMVLSQQARATGVLPQDLTNLQGEMLIDPFTGEPLKFIPGPNGFVLYSVGKNRVDDGGEVFPNHLEKDILWSFERKRN